MRTPPRMAARMAAMIVAALTAAAPGVAAPDGAPLILFPEVVDESATDAPPGGESSAIGGVPADAVPAQPAAGDTRAGETPDAPDTGDMDRAEASPEPASRLLRALAERQDEAAVSARSGASDAERPGTLRVYAAEGCPRALLRRLLAGVADDAGALTALGIEREVLTLCRERQEIVTGLFETEARLKELRAAAEPTVPAGTAAAVVVAPAPAVRESVTPRPAQPSPLRAALAAAGKADEADTRAGARRAEELQAPARVSPRYAWFSIIGTAGALRAGVTDGTGVWFVREGDPLPGGAHVAAIAARPPAVRVSAPDGTAEQTPLPYRARPGDGS